MICVNNHTKFKLQRIPTHTHTHTYTHTKTQIILKYSHSSILYIKSIHKSLRPLLHTHIHTRMQMHQNKYIFIIKTIIKKIKNKYSHPPILYIQIIYKTIIKTNLTPTPSCTHTHARTQRKVRLSSQPHCTEPADGTGFFLKEIFLLKSLLINILTLSSM